MSLLAGFVRQLDGPSDAGNTGSDTDDEGGSDDGKSDGGQNDRGDDTLPVTAHGGSW